MKQETKDALIQMAKWAESYVENETGIPETPRDKLTDAEKGALLILDLLGDL